MADVSFPLLVSIAALVVSILTAYITLFRRGTLKATRPTVIFFGPDGPKEINAPRLPKIFLRTLLYSTGKRGKIIESMYVAVRRGETHQIFNVWAYGETTALSRGSGLFVGESGIAFNHHFLLPSDGSNFVFVAGDYTIDLYADVVGDSSRLHLGTMRLTVSDSLAKEISESRKGIYFDWGPDSRKYHAHAR